MKIVGVARMRDEETVLPYLVANTGFVDRMILVDGGSIDRTLGLARELAQERPHLRVESWPGAGKPFDRQWEHWNCGFELAREEAPDYLLYLDADEIPNIPFQEGLRPWLEGHGSLEGSFGYTCKFPYILPHWREYHGPFSQYPATRVRNHVPTIVPNGDRKEFAFPEPGAVIPLPYEMMVTHWTWVLRDRDQRKMIWHVQHFGMPHPMPPCDRNNRIPMAPSFSRWYDADGKEVGVAEMEGRFD